MSDGLRKKYIITKADTGEEVEDCFVLRPVKDAAAVVAIRAYASVTKNKTLSADLLRWVGRGTMTNADRIRQMSDEELAVVLCAGDCENRKCKGRTCIECWLDWLREEADE